MKVQGEFVDSTLSSWIAAITTIAVTLAVSYALYQGFKALGLTGNWELLSVPVTIVSVIAVGGGTFAAISPMLRALTEKGARHLVFEGGVVRMVEDEVAVDLGDRHIAQLSLLADSAHVTLQGPRQGREAGGVYRAVVRQRVALSADIAAFCEQQIAKMADERDEHGTETRR